MFCKNCGKEIDADSNFCVKCGEKIEVEEKITPAETANKTSECANQMIGKVDQGTKEFAEKSKSFVAKEKNNYKNFKNLSIKQKIIRIVVPMLILIVLINIFSSGNSSNSYVIEADSGSTFGNVTFDLTFDEFINNYNSCIDKDEEFESVAQMRYLKASGFDKNTLDGGVIEYSQNLGYNFGTTFKALAKLYIYVNPNTDTIQFIEYKWKRDGYNTEDAEINYYFTLPATIFSMLDDSIAFPFDGDSSSYKETYDAIADDGIVVKGDSFYKYMSADEDTHSIVFFAATKNSPCYKSNKDI